MDDSQNSKVFFEQIDIQANYILDYGRMITRFQILYSPKPYPK